MTNTEQETRAEFVKGLRDVAAWIEANPQVPLPSPAQNGVPLRISVPVLSWRDGVGDIDVPAAFAEAVKALGGTREKDAGDHYMKVTRAFGPGLELYVWTTRDEVCEAVVVGTETVEVEKVITPAVTETVTEERDVIEWRCAPVLAIAEAS